MRTSANAACPRGRATCLSSLSLSHSRPSRRHARGLAMALIGLLVATGGCGKKGRLFEPPGAPFVLRIPPGWEVKQAKDSLLVLHGPPDEETILPVIPTVRIKWYPTSKGATISGMSLSPDASLKELTFLTGGNTSVGGGMLARWISYSFKGDGQRIGAMDWLIQGKGCRLTCELLTPEVNLEVNEKATRFLLDSLEMKERPTPTR